MRPDFHPRTVNDPFGDPGLFIPFLFEKRAFMFDLGDIHSLPAKDILKISHVFISHTHIDHFAGFERLLRLFLGREKELFLYGPEGLIKNVEGKLAGFSWNLVHHFTHRFIIHLVEIRTDRILKNSYPCHHKFLSEQAPEKSSFNPILLKEPHLTVSTVILDHGIPCLGFTLEERFHVNIIKEALAEMDLAPGPWLIDFKQALYNGITPDTRFSVFTGKIKPVQKQFVLEELSKRIAVITQGQKITYITDVADNVSNREKIVAFARGSDHLFIEAAFLDADREIAKKKYHLTARQAGSIAKEACAKRYTLFHFSPRYPGQANMFHREAQAAFLETPCKSDDAGN